MSGKGIILTFLFSYAFSIHNTSFSLYRNVHAVSLAASWDAGTMGNSDSLINFVMSFSSEEMLLDSLMKVVNGLPNESADSSLKALNECILYFGSTANDAAVAHLQYARSHLYMRLSQYPEALVGLNRSLEMYRKIMLNQQVGMCYYDMAWIHQKQGNFDRFLEYAKLAAQYYKDLPEGDKTCLVAMTLAIAYHSTDSLAQSLHHLFEYNKMARRIRDVNHMAQSLGKIGTFYWNADVEAPLDSARKYFKMEWQIAQQDSSGRALLMAGIDMGSVEKKGKNYDRALYYFDIALSKAEQNRRVFERQWIMQTMAETYALAGKYDKAYKTFRTYAHLKDSIFSEEKNLQVTELEEKYEAEKKDKQITLLAQEKAIQEKETQRQSTIKKAFIAGFVLTTLLAALVIYITRQRFRNQKLLAEKDKEIKEANFRQQLGELEMKALRAQINPHFLYNCMNSINRMILEKENEMASQYLAKFSKLVRLILENAEKSNVSLQNELTMLEAYINLEGLRFKGKINYTISVDESVDPEATYLPSMVLQPFVENAIWHGLMNKKDGDEGWIKISVKEEDEILNCTIEDNGIGREAAYELRKKSILKTRSMGMKITEERLKLIAKDGWGRFINIIDLKDRLNRALGTRVEITIPLHNQI